MKKINNVLYRKYREARKTPGDFFFTSHMARRKLCHKYAFAIPNTEALKCIAKYGPLIEVGAGRGYWARLLQDRGVDIIACDSAPPTEECTERNDYFANKGTFTEVLQKSCWDITRSDVAGRTLMLCWPPYGSDMAYDCLKRYLSLGGKRLVYIGEGEGGCNGSERFFDLLESRMKCIDGVDIPQWGGIHDYLSVYELNSGRPD